MSGKFDVEAARRHFPGLDQGQVFFDNAGGSQTLKGVIDSISSYLSTTNVQLGASYATSQTCTRMYSEASAAAASYMNAAAGEVVLGPSTTQLFRNLSQALYSHVTAGSEIVVSKLDHEANIGSWVALAERRGATVRWWTSADRDSPELDLEALRGLLNERTRLVTCMHASNVLGTISDIRAVADVVHGGPAGDNALLCVDGVALAPHGPVDVAALGVDVYAFSWYKVYGPHMAALYVSHKAQAAHLDSLGHYFRGPPATLEDRLGLAGASYELMAGIPSVCRYLAGLSWEALAEHEGRLQAVLIEYLNSRPDLFRIKGHPTADRARRLPVISFVVEGRSSKSVVEAIEARSNIGCRFGSFYSNRLVKEVLGLDDADGVVRASFCHYNTEEEVRSLVKVLEDIVNS